VRVRSSKLPPSDRASQERGEKRKRTRAEAGEIIPQARASWRQGDYGAIKRELSRIDTDFLDAPEAAAVGVLLGCAYVGTGDSDSAIAAFQKVLERRPGHTLDAYTYSPKIRALWQKAGGKVTDE
jgi:hypothetical protein